MGTSISHQVSLVSESSTHGIMPRPAIFGLVIFTSPGARRSDYIDTLGDFRN